MSPDEPQGRLAGARFICCNGEREHEIARALRDRVFWTKRQVAFSRSAECRRDADGHLFVLFRGVRPVATARCQHYPSDISLVEQLRATASHALPADTEVGRIASAGSALDVLTLLALGAVWLLESTRHRRYSAYCHPKLVPMYCRVGAWDTGERCDVPGRDTEHVIIAGRYEDCARLGLEMLGADWTRAAAAVRFLGAGCGAVPDRDEPGSDAA